MSNSEPFMSRARSRQNLDGQIPPSPPLPSKTILIVDDFGPDRAAYRRFLEAEGEYTYQILEATSGQEGIRQFQMHRPDVVLLDYRLPDMEGIALMAQLQRSVPHAGVSTADASDPNPALIVLTGQGHEAIAVQVMKAGATDYLVKGHTSPEDLRLAVRGAIETQQLRLRLQQSEAALRQSEAVRQQQVNESTERLQLALWASGQGIWDWDLKTQTLTWDNRCKQIFGLPPDTAVTYEWHLNVLHPEDRQRVVEATVTALSQRTEFDEEYRTFHPDGSIRWIRARGRGFYDLSGQPYRMTGTVTDMTERKRTSMALQESESRFRTLADNIAQLVWMADQTGSIFWYNQRWFEYTGTRLEEMLGWGWQQVHHPDHVERATQKFRQCVEAGEFWEDTFPLRGRDGQYRWFLSRALPICNEQGQVVRWFGTNTDISDRIQIEQQLMQADRIKDEFLAVLSHELRSPLNPILGWVKLLQSRQYDAARTAEALATIERNAKLQSQLIDDLLDISRVMQGKLSLNSAPVNLNSVITAAIETVRLAAEAKQIQLVAQLDPPDPLVFGDAGRLQQVAWNLLSNAVKFTPSGGRIEVTLARCQDDTGNHSRTGDPEKDGGMRDQGAIAASHQNATQISPPCSAAPIMPPPSSLILLTVSDTGKGIAPQFLPHVFEYFRQEDGSTTRKYGGLGLGLAIARQIVEMHGGTISVDSAGEGQGATFTVRLPVWQHEGSRMNAESEASAPLSALPLQGTRVLVVDDEVDTRNFLVFLLQEQGASATAAASAAEALSQIQQLAPDLLLSDIGMPEVDGYSLLQTIRALPGPVAEVPAIALTAYAGEIDRQRAQAVGFQDHVAKPVEPDLLIAKALTCLKRQG